MNVIVNGNLLSLELKWCFCTFRNYHAMSLAVITVQSYCCQQWWPPHAAWEDELVQVPKVTNQVFLWTDIQISTTKAPTWEWRACQLTIFEEGWINLSSLHTWDPTPPIWIINDTSTPLKYPGVTAELCGGVQASRPHQPRQERSRIPWSCGGGIRVQEPPIVP